jgi:hypothetical protein
MLNSSFKEIQKKKKKAGRETLSDGENNFIKYED